MLRYNILSNETQIKILVIKENILRIREKIASACARSGREAREVTLVCVSKNRAFSDIQQVWDSGIRDVGENRVQEALLKFKSLKAQEIMNSSALKFHMVGHLQTNKVKDAVKIFDLIHSVDSLHLALEIEKQAARINKIQDILIEVNVSGEESKFGAEPGHLPDLIKAVGELKNVRLRGLMTIAPAADDPEKARPYFRKLRELKDQINGTNGQNEINELTYLSMGMSDDFEIAIEEGSTMVRIGRAVFEGAGS